MQNNKLYTCNLRNVSWPNYGIYYSVDIVSTTFRGNSE